MPTNPKRFCVQLCFSSLVTEEGIKQEFKLADPNQFPPETGIADELARRMGVNSDDDAFHYGTIFLDIPDQVVARIKAS